MDKQQRNELDGLLSRTHGIAFEDFVVSLLRLVVDPYAWKAPSYREDGGCDAYVPSQRAVYQIYGPASGFVAERDVLDKLRTDAAKLLAHWSPTDYDIDKFFFVVNVRELTLSIQQATMTALPGVEGCALGRGALIALADRLSPLQAEHRLGLPAFPAVEDRRTVARFLAMLDKHCEGTQSVWSYWGFSADAYRAVWNSELHKEMSEGANPMMSADEDIQPVQLKLVNSIREVMRTVAVFGDIHEERENNPTAKKRHVYRMALPPFDVKARARHREFDALVGPMRNEVQRCYQILENYANSLPMGLQVDPLPMRTWEYRG